MNILMVTDNFFPDVMGGSGRVVNEISKGLIKRGHNIHILAPRINRKLPQQEDMEGVKIHRYNVSLKTPGIFITSSLINEIHTFNRISEETRFDLINFHQPRTALGINLSKKAKEIPGIYTFHSSWPEEYRIKTERRGIGFLMRHLIERKILESCKKITVLSEYSKKQLLTIHSSIDAKKIEIVHGGVDTARFTSTKDKKLSKDELGIPLDKLFLFTLRNLAPRMGLENLIDAMSIIVKERPDALLIIGGEGFLKEKLKKKVINLGLRDYIKFTGCIEDEKLPLYYQAADIFILPTRDMEGFGLVTLEALSCGTPVLGTPVGGTEEILAGLDRDLLFGGIDARSMAEKILYCLSSYNLQGLGIKCRDYVLSHYSWERMACGYERVYSENIQHYN